MRSVLRLSLVLMPAIPALLAAGCSGGGDDNLSIAVIGSSGSLFESGKLSPFGRLVRGATSQGLVAFDEEGRVVPALADHWIVTDDGLSYIFRLRDGTWADGSPLTAVSARTALQKSLADLKGTPLGASLAAISPQVDSLIQADVWVEPRFVIEVAAAEITRSPRHTCGKVDREQGYSLRFPRMIQFRFDRRPDDATTEKEIVDLYQVGVGSS